MSEVKNILLVGVGGQGTILASKILVSGLLQAGYDVKMSEIHGMSQRGGNVSTQIRYGEKVYSPIVGEGDADVIVAFEKMEALRWLSYLKPKKGNLPGGKMVINDYEIPPLPVLLGAAKYPLRILDELQEKADIAVFKASDLAEELGNSKTMNVILLGALVKALGLADDARIDWKQAVRDNVKPQFEEMNQKAFQIGLAQL